MESLARNVSKQEFGVFNLNFIQRSFIQYVRKHFEKTCVKRIRGQEIIVFLNILCTYKMDNSIITSLELYEKRALSGLIQFLASESPLEMIKNVSYFILKTLFVLKKFKICFKFLIMQKNGLIKKIRLISRFMTLQPG